MKACLKAKPPLNSPEADCHDGNDDHGMPSNLHSLLTKFYNLIGHQERIENTKMLDHRSPSSIRPQIMS